MDNKQIQKELYKVRYRLRMAQGEGMYSLDCFGDYVAKREGYKTLEGIEALHYYLVQKYHWLPSQVKALNIDDLEFLFSEEKEGWTLPEDACEPDL